MLGWSKWLIHLCQAGQHQRLCTAVAIERWAAGWVVVGGLGQTLGAKAMKLEGWKNLWQMEADERNQMDTRKRAKICKDEAG